jgi:hypothetical protein
LVITVEKPAVVKLLEGPINRVAFFALAILIAARRPAAEKHCLEAAAPGLNGRGCEPANRRETDRSAGDPAIHSAIP